MDGWAHGVGSWAGVDADLYTWYAFTVILNWNNVLLTKQFTLSHV